MQTKSLEQHRFDPKIEEDLEVEREAPERCGLR